MRIMIFIENNDKKIFYKCDTFWSISSNIKYAKVYSDSSLENINSLIVSYDYNLLKVLEKDPTKLSEIINSYNNCKMGYRFVDGFTIKRWMVRSRRC